MGMMCSLYKACITVVIQSKGFASWNKQEDAVRVCFSLRETV